MATREAKKGEILIDRRCRKYHLSIEDGKWFAVSETRIGSHKTAEKKHDKKETKCEDTDVVPETGRSEKVVTCERDSCPKRYPLKRCKFFRERCTGRVYLKGKKKKFYKFDPNFTLKLTDRTQLLVTMRSYWTSEAWLLRSLASRHHTDKFIEELTCNQDSISKAWGRYYGFDSEDKVRKLLLKLLLLLRRYLECPSIEVEKAWRKGARQLAKHLHKINSKVAKGDFYLYLAKFLSSFLQLVSCPDKEAENFKCFREDAERIGDYLSNAILQDRSCEFSFS